VATAMESNPKAAQAHALVIIINIRFLLQQSMIKTYGNPE